MNLRETIRRSPYSPTLLKQRLLQYIPFPTLTFRLYLWVRGLHPSVQFSEHDPFKIYWINPDRIERISGNTRPVLWSSVKAGSWDQEPESFVNTPVYKSIKQHYQNDVSWAETPLFGEFWRKAQYGDAWGYTTVEQFNRRIKEIESLVESICEDGYKRQTNIQQQNWTDTNDPVPPALNEVTVDLGRDGEPLWRDFGQHRLAVAKIFDIEKIPVLIGARHELWIAGTSKTDKNI